MQLPFSLLDQRLLKDGSLKRLKQLGVEIHARSLFLQGLLFMSEPPEKLGTARPMMESVRAQIALQAPHRLQPRLALCCRDRRWMLR